MAKYRQVQTCFWSDTKVLDEMDFIDRYFYLYLLTNPHVTQSGCYEISISQMTNESGIEEKEIRKLLKKFEEEFEVIIYDYKTKELLIMNFYKYNWTSSLKVKTCVEKEILQIKSKKIIDYAKAIFNKIYPMHRLSFDEIYPMDRQSQEKEKEKEKEKGGGKKFATTTSPSFFDLQSIIEYGLQKGVDEKYSKRFFDYYEKKKWMCGKTKVEDWRVKFDEWITEDEIEGKKSVQTNQPKQVSESAFTL